MMGFIGRMISRALSGNAMSIDPMTLYAIGAGVGGIGSYFGGASQSDAAKDNAQLGLQAQREARDYQTQNNRAAMGYIDAYTPGQYTNPNSGTIDTSINSFINGQLTPTQLQNQQRDIASGTQSLTSAAATAGLPAGARLGLTNQMSSDIANKYATIADNSRQFGLTSALSNQNYGLQQFLANQGLLQNKLNLQTQYATGPNSN